MDAPYDDPRLTAMGLFLEAHSGLMAVVNAQFAQHGLSETEFEVLIRLARSPHQRLRMTDLAAQTSLSTSGITRVVDRLERTGLVAREPCAHDRRGFNAVLTSRGDSKVRETLVGHLEIVERWYTGLLSPRQLEEFTAALRVMRDAVRPDAVAGADAADEDRAAGERSAQPIPAGVS